MYYMFNVFYLKKRPQVEGNDIVKKEPKKTKQQSDLENGSVEIGLKEKKQNQDKEKIAQGYDNKAYSEDQMKIESAKPSSKDIEALNNAKNLDKIEKISESGHQPEEKKMQDKTVSKKDNNGITNPALEDKSEDDKHNVTIEKEPKEKK